MQLSSIHTTTFFYNCKDLFKSILYEQPFSHQRFLEKIFAVSCVVCKALLTHFVGITQLVSNYVLSPNLKPFVSAASQLVLSQI